MQHPTTIPRYVSISQAAQETGLSAYELRQGVARGRFPYVRCGRTNKRVCVADILAALAEEAQHNREEAKAQCGSSL